MRTEDIAVLDAGSTFPAMNVGTVCDDLKADRDMQPASGDERYGFQSEDAAAAPAAKRTTSELCHDVAMFAALITIIVILLPHLLRFARIGF